MNKKEFKLPKKWYIINNPSIEKELHKWRGGLGYSSYKDAIIVMVSEKHWSSLELVESTHTEITFEQFKKYVLNINETKNSVMKTFPITRSQFRDIHNIACSGWKSKIATMVQEKLGMFGTSCELEQAIVEEMFKAANVTQTEVLVKIFPDYSTYKSIDLRDKRTDELFTCNSLEGGMINIRNGGKYMGKAFYLDNEYEWKMEKDDCDDLCLIPTRK